MKPPADTPTERYAPTSPSRGRDKLTYRPQSKLQSRYMRKHMTEAEGLLWYYLRDFRDTGFYFRRQVPIGSYIVDFTCLNRKLIIELDGGHHTEKTQELHDLKRDEWLQSNGYSVIRFDNSDIFKNCDMVLRHIQNALDQSLPLSGGGGRSVCENATVGGGTRSHV